MLNADKVERVDYTNAYIVNLKGANGKVYKALQSYNTIVAVVINGAWKLIREDSYSNSTSSQFSRATGVKWKDKARAGEVLTFKEKERIGLI